MIYTYDNPIITLLISHKSFLFNYSSCSFQLPGLWRQSSGQVLFYGPPSYSNRRHLSDTHIAAANLT